MAETQTLSSLCDACRVINQNFGSYHYTPKDLEASAEIGCLGCRLIWEAARDKILTTNRHAQIILGVKSDILYKIFEYPDRWNNLFLRFDLVRQRGRFPFTLTYEAYFTEF